MATYLVDEGLLVLVVVGIDVVLEEALINVLEAIVAVNLEDEAKEEEVEEEVDGENVGAAIPIVVMLDGIPIA